MSKWKIIKIPNHFGAPVPGTNEGPNIIVNYLVNELGIGKIIKDVESVPIPKIYRVNGKRKDEKIKNVAEVRLVWKEVERVVYRTVKSGNIPLIFHGDDSAVCPEVWGVAHGLSTGNFGIIYLDAHGDANTPETTPSGFLYGMGIAHMIGFGVPSLVNLKPRNIVINGDNIILVGQRSFDKGEKEFLKSNQVKIFESKDVYQNVDKVCNIIKSEFQKRKINDIYLHFDQDVVDPKESGACLCQVDDGLRANELLDLVSFLKKNFNFVGISVGNYLPSIDREKKTLFLIIKFLKTLGIL